MNYYNRHIGDYAKQTAHLTFAEDGAYNRLLDYYYASEQPLPLDCEVLYRKVRARSKPERALIDQILVEFFHKEADGWHKNRCDEEIEKYQLKAEKNRENGTHGGRPRKPNNNPEITQSVSKDNPNETLASSQKPVANNQEPEKSKPLGSSEKPLSPEEVEIFLTLNDKTEYPVSKALVAEWGQLYPAVDVPQTLREIKGWFIANPSKRKTKSGILRCVNSWLSREQNKG